MTIHRYATLTAVTTFLLLIAGSLVTSTDSGLAVPDWPLSYGTWFPPMVGGIRYEHGHRMIAGTVGLMILVLAVWLARTEPRVWVRRLGYTALGAVILQALLGGLTVLLLLPPQISIAHAALGQTVFCLVVCLASCTSPSWAERVTPIEDHRWPPLRILGVSTALLAAAQLLLGAVIRHTGYAVSAHLVGAVAVLLAVSWLTARARTIRQQTLSVWRSAVRLCWLVTAQLALGASVFLHRGSIPLRTAHVALGALVLAQAVTLAWDTVRRIHSAGHGSSARRRITDYLELTKARLSALVLLTTAVGFWLGMRAGEQLPLLFFVCAGTALVVGGANALNQWMERLPDALMRRTQHRPLPAGRLAPRHALRFGIAMSAAGILVLAVTVNMLTAVLAAVSWASYVLVYTPMKRWTPFCTLLGAVPGALPPVIGWAAARGVLGLEAWTLFAILFIWQLPHFLSLAVLYRDDYERAGFPMLPIIDTDGLMTARQTALYGLALLPISLFPTLIGVAGAVYFYGAAALTALFVVIATRAAWVRSPQTARQLFGASVLYLPVLLVLLALDRTPL